MSFRFRFLIFTFEVFAMDIDPSDGDIKIGVRISWKRPVTP